MMLESRKEPACSANDLSFGSHGFHDCAFLLGAREPGFKAAGHVRGVLGAFDELFEAGVRVG